MFKLRIYKSDLMRLAANTYKVMDYWELVDAYSFAYPDEPLEKEKLIEFIADNFIKENNVEVLED